MSKADREHLADNLAADMTVIDRKIAKRVVENLKKADPELGEAVVKGAKL